jgi:DNA-binding NarL/FixJ family response regulator
MQVFWEQIGVLGPIYRLVGQGLNDGDIATHLGLTEVSVQDCIAWLLRFLGFTNREELALYASSAA